MPYDYYTLPFCKPAAGVVMSAENLGEFLTGDRIDNSPYQLYMRDDSYCNILCQQKYNKKDVDTFKKAIHEEYHHNWIIDNLPVRGHFARDPLSTEKRKKEKGEEKTPMPRGACGCVVC